MNAYQRACKNAIDVQNSCNFSGVLRSFFEDMRAVYDHLEATGNNGSHERATHPVAILYMDKLAELQHRPGWQEFGTALQACEAAINPSEAVEIPAC